MRYLDSGKREASQALGTWLAEVLTDDASEVRWQSGFFSSDSLGTVQQPLRRLTEEHGSVRALIGSNDMATARADVERLINTLGMPRENACVGVVSFAGAYFHPKTFHVRRRNGSQASYIGSANLTGSGVSSLHVEAGIILDSQEGDAAEILDAVAAGVDAWFDSERPGVYQVGTPDDIARLVADGILADGPPPRVHAQSSGEGIERARRATLRPLVALPKLVVPGQEVVEAAEVRNIAVPAAPRRDFPQYLLFAPGENTPTAGASALSGSALPRGVSGLIVRLNRDSARHFEGRPGTANISIPVATLSTFRFGLYPGQYPRPRAEFPLEIRYLSNDLLLRTADTATNIMAYGFIPGESGHGDVRMLVPAQVKGLANDLRDINRALPAEGDVALLEWPTSNNGYAMRLSFLERGSELYQQAAGLFNQAQEKQTTIGEGACWLPQGLSPEW